MEKNNLYLAFQDAKQLWFNYNLELIADELDGILNSYLIGDIIVGYYGPKDITFDFDNTILRFQTAKEYIDYLISYQRSLRSPLTAVMQFPFGDSATKLKHYDLYTIEYNGYEIFGY